MNPPDAPATRPTPPGAQAVAGVPGPARPGPDLARPGLDPARPGPDPARRSRTGQRPAPEQRPAPPDESAGEPADELAPDELAPEESVPEQVAPREGSATPATGPAGDGLTGRERDILAFERQWWKHAGAKEQAIRDTFGLSATRYYQLLNNLLDNPAALAAEPQLIGRLLRLRAARARSRRR